VGYAKSPQYSSYFIHRKEHQEYPYSMDDYVSAKANIVRTQSSEDLTIYNKDNKYSQEIATKSKAKTIGYPDELSAHFDNDNFYYNEQLICSIHKSKLIGNHNKREYMCRY